MASSNNELKPAMDFTDVELFTSLRYDPLLENHDVDATNSTSTNNNNPSNPKEKSPFYLLQYHHDRILEAAAHLHWPLVQETLPTLPSFEEKIVKDMQAKNISPAPTKVRFAINQHGKFTISYMPLPPVPITTLFPPHLPHPSPSPPHQTFENVYIDTHPSPTSPATTYKTTHRTVYDNACARFAAVLPSSFGGEVLIWDAEGEVLEGTYTSVYFWRGGRWVTPPVATGPEVWKGHKGTSRRWALERGICGEEVVGRESVGEGEVVWLSNGARGFWTGRVVASELGGEGELAV
ncbi:hypothetical protein CC80DRAFT_590789 [Byssothecium circinans]|uniref:D-aminoacid aminotransferase-like PLP-dependent enzyme n=1 Tax=Byssothecium circinans TaxID=147558 RepID=A0A6A5U3Y8_9PLEO|nr:hypothetical protein CC80DRAFT_590789 [Byssothecium circinans]